MNKKIQVGSFITTIAFGMLAYNVDHGLALLISLAVMTGSATMFGMAIQEEHGA